MAPPKALADTPEPAVSSTPSNARVTRSASRQANQGASRGAGRAGPRTDTPSKESADTPRLRARTSNAYGGTENTELAIKKVVAKDDANNTIDSVSAAVNEAIDRTTIATRQSQPRSTASPQKTQSSPRAPSEIDSDNSSAPSSRGNVRRRRSRQSLNTIDETSEVGSVVSSSHHQDSSLLDTRGATGLNTPYGELATSSEINSALQSKPQTPLSVRSRPSRSPTTRSAANGAIGTSHWTDYSARIIETIQTNSWSLFILFTVIPILLAMGYSVLTSFASPTSDIVRAVQSYAGAAVHSVPTLSMQQAHMLEKRIKNLESRVEQIVEMLSGVQGRVSNIETELPDRLVVRVVDGNYTITDEFWYALKARLANEQASHSESPWSHFLRSQKVKISEYMRGPDGGEADKAYTDWLNKHDLITRPEFVELLNENMRQLHRDVDYKVSAIERSVSLKAMEASSSLIRNNLASKPEWEAVPHVLTSLARNYQLKMHSKNYFALSTGAAVDPFMSSPTAEPQMSVPQRFFWKYVRRIWANPHSAAIDDWTEPRECWCTSERQQSNDEPADAVNGPKAQLAVTMPRPFYPRSISVEHVPASGTTDWKATPKEMELWVSVPGATERESIARHTNAIFWAAADRDRPGNGLQRYDLDESYVLLHSWVYNAYGTNHMQNFPLNVDVSRHGVTVNKAVVRATSNYGANFTCIYRLRLHGEEPENMQQS